MLGTLIKSCTTLGYRQMIAIIGDSGNAGSIRLHARHGFRLVGTLAAAGFKHGRWVDTVLMQRARSEEHTSELQSLMRISYAVFCLKKKITTNQHYHKAMTHT